MEKRNIIVMGASAGGFDAFQQLIAQLPADLDAAIFIVWHMAATVRGILPQVLRKLTAIPVDHARDGEVIQTGRIYVAPPDHHLLLEDGRVRVTHGPKENRFRPAIDPLFRSAAYAYGNRVVGVLLSGALDDGTAGMWAIKNRGGLTLVQDPQEALVPAMPQNAIRQVAIDFVVPAAELGSLLGLLVRFRCHTGHAYSADSLLAAITEKVEDSLYSAIRGMDESVVLLNQLGDQFAEVNQPRQAALCFQKAQESSQRSELIRQVIRIHEPLSQENLDV